MSRYRPHVYLPSLLLLACGGTDGKIAAVSTLELTVVGTPPSATSGSLRAALLWTNADYSLFEVAATADAPAPGQTVKFSHIAPPVSVMGYFRNHDTSDFREASLGVVVLFEDGDGDGTLAQDFDPERPLAFAPAVRRPDRIVGIAHDQAAMYFGGPYTDDGAPVELDPFLDTDNGDDWFRAHNSGHWFSVRNFDGVPQGLMLAKLNCDWDELSVKVGGQGIVEVEGLVRAPEPRFEDRIQLFPQPKPRACQNGGEPLFQASVGGDNKCEDPAPWSHFYYDGVPGARCIMAGDCASICCTCPDKPGVVYSVSMCSGDGYCADATTACADMEIQRWCGGP